MKKKGKTKMGMLTGAIAAIIVYVYLQNNWVQVEHIDVAINNLPEELKGLKIAHVSDVHIPLYAPDTERFVKILQREKPDIIALTGDILDGSGKWDNPDFIKFCADLADIAVTYAVTGNHEARRRDAEKWAKAIGETDVLVVENRVEIFKKGSSMIAFMGLRDGSSYSVERFRGLEMAKDIPRILLAHRPELFDSYCSDSNEVRPALVLSGHAHGGQFRIPFLKKGVVAPHQGFLPKYTSGLYVSESGVQMVVSRGLGSSIIPVRLNNRPHLPIIHLQ
ncbi:MAG TPA: metallophosphoesterase [Clostridia bacterium]|nr:metallophosphoesterase [Clostridia bacterium]